MTLLNHTLGFPRIGLRCELKMVAEFVQGQPFKLTWTQRLDEIDEALANRVKAAQNLRNAQ